MIFNPFASYTGGSSISLERNIARAKTDIKTLMIGIERFKTENISYPTTEEGLQALISNPNSEKNKNWKKIFKKHPVDPWGEYYKYRYPGIKSEFDLFTFGPDGIQSEDDIGSWQLEK